MSSFSSLVQNSRSSSTWLESHREWLSNAFGATSSTARSPPQDRSGRRSTTTTTSDSLKKNMKVRLSEKKVDLQPGPIVGFSHFTLAQSKLRLQQPEAAIECLFEVLRKHDQLDVQVLLSKEIATYIQMKMLEAKARYQIALLLLQYPSILLSRRCPPLLAINRNTGSGSVLSEMSSFHQALAELEYCHGMQLSCRNLWQGNETMTSCAFDQQLVTFDKLQQDYQATCEQLAMLQCKQHNYLEAVIKYNEAKDVLASRLKHSLQEQPKPDLELQLARLWFHLGTLHYKAKRFKQARDSYGSSLKLFCCGRRRQLLTQQDRIRIKQMKHRTGIKSNMYASCSMTYWTDRNSV